MDCDEDDIVILCGMFLLNEGKRKRQRSVSTRRILSRGAEQSEMNLVTETSLYDEHSHVAYFRMTRATFDVLLQKVSPLIAHANTHCDPILPKQRLAVTLRILATGDSQQKVGLSFGMGKATVHKIFKETCEALIEVLSDLIPPPSESSWRMISNDFESRWDLPHCIGAVDGKFVRTHNPARSGGDFIFLRLLTSVDCDYCFTYFDIESSEQRRNCAESLPSDFSRILKSGELNIPPSETLSDVGCIPYFFVAGETFSLNDHLQILYPCEELTSGRRIFNYRLNRARRICENALGVLATGWHIFHKPLLVQVETAKKLVQTTLLLHNFLKQQDCYTAAMYRYMSESEIDFENSEGEITPGRWRQDIDRAKGFRNIVDIPSDIPSTYAVQTRDKLCNFFNNAGAIAFQSTVERQI